MKTDDANSMDSEKNGNKGDIVFGKNSKGKDVLAIHNGIEWKYCVTYSSRELKDLDSKYRMLEKKVLNLEKNSSAILLRLLPFEKQVCIPIPILAPPFFGIIHA